MTPLTVSSLASRVLVDVPVDIEREEARDAARDELAKREYHLDDPTLIERALDWVFEQIDSFASRALEATPGGWFGLVVIGLVVALAVVAIVRKVGPTARSATSDTSLFVGRTRSAAEHRRLADELAARGDLDGAVTERYRAVVRTLEERGLLDPRPGRTADEAAREGAAVLPDVARQLDDGARGFDEVLYGGNHASASDEQRMRQLDDLVRTTRPTVRIGA